MNNGIVPTHEQLIANIQAMESQGAQPQEIQQYLNQFKGQTPGQPTTVPQQNNLAPSQASAALGHSTSGIMSFLGGVADTAGNIATGAALGAAKTVESADVLNTMHKLSGEPTVQDVTGADITKIQPQGGEQQVGQTAERIGEFFAPAGAEKATFAKAAPYIEKIPELLGIAGTKAKTLVSALKIAAQGAITGTSMGGVTLGQTGDVKQAGQAAEFGAPFGAVGKALEEVSPGMLQAIAKSGFKLSPAAEAKTTKIVDRASSFIADNKITGSDASKYNKLAKLTRDFETTLQKSLPEGISVPKKEIAQHIESGVEQLRTTDPAVYNRARAKADEALKLLQEHPSDSQFTQGGTVSVKDSLSNKRSWAQEAFRGAQQAKKDPEKTNEGAYVVEKAYQTALENTLDRTGTNAIKIPPQLQKYFGGKTETTIGDFNKVYSPAISARDLMFTAQFKHDAGLFGRLFGIAVGEIAGSAIAPGPVGKIVGMTGGELLTQRIPQAVRGLGEKLLTKPEVVPAAAKVIQGATNAAPPSNQ